MNIINRNIRFLLFFLMLSIRATSQQSYPATNINEITIGEQLTTGEAFFISSIFNSQQEFFTLNPTKSVSPPFLISTKNVSQKILFSFSLSNKKQTEASCYFYPGNHFSNVAIYQIKGNRIITIENVLPAHINNASYRQLSIPANDSVTFLAELIPLKTYTNYFTPTIINSNSINIFIENLPNKKYVEGIASYFFCGMLLIMALLSLINYFQNKKREFLYYSLYALFLGYMLFTKQYYFSKSSIASFYNESYLDFILQSTGMCFYLLFLHKFISSKTKYPSLYKLFVFTIFCLVIIMFAFTYLHFWSDNFYLQNFLENILAKGLLFLVGIVFLLFSLVYWKDILLRYLFIGTFFYLFFSLASLFLIWFNFKLPTNSIFNSSLFWYEVGLFIELFFFLMGLTYKNRKELIHQVAEREAYKKENEKKDLEKQIAVFNAQQEVRNNIAADVHDELGAGMTHILLLSEILKSKSSETSSKEITIISNSAADLLKKMSMLAWSINTKNDSLSNFINYIQSTSSKYFEGTLIEFSYKAPQQILSKELNGQTRRNLYLSVTELLTNTAKHSKATSVVLNIELNHQLVITVIDNGIGIDLNNLNRIGNGLTNITNRMDEIQGTFSIKNNENGTTAVLALPL